MSSEISHNKCLNCQTELQGKYCHVCGQKATHRKPSVKEFILEYLNIVFVWDTGFIKTLWQLISKPGHLTKEYVSGKFVSYMHPLKLNMFLLVTFITMFVLFHSAENMGNLVQRVTRDEMLHPVVIFSSLEQDKEYVASMQSSERDTVQLYAPSTLLRTYPEYFALLDEDPMPAEDSIGVWTVVLPHKLVEDKVIIYQESGSLAFNLDFEYKAMGAETLEEMWRKLVKMSTNYFPLLILLTAPLLSFIIRLVQRKGNHTQFGHFVFSLHYTAFLEVIIILLYILQLIVSPPSWVMTSTLSIGSFIYLIAAIKRVYQPKRWTSAVIQAMVIDLAYCMILAGIFFVICVISIISVVIQLAAV